MHRLDQARLAHPARAPQQRIVGRQAARELERVFQQRVARAVDPDNAALAAYAAWCEAERAAGRPTLPARMGQEVLINPFLRCEQAPLRDAARRHAPSTLMAAPEPVDVFATLREWKNGFR